MARIQTFFSSEFLASGNSPEFHEFIVSVTESKSKAEEHSHVTNELRKLTAQLGQPDITSARMKDYLIRLLHCFMLGYNVDFGLIYAIMASQSGETAIQRRVGYLACTLFLESNHELGIMLINTLQRDLKSQNYLDRCAALNAIGYLDVNEIQDAVYKGVVDCMNFEKQIVRKKAVLALYFLYERNSALLSQVEPLFRSALEDKDPSVVFAALSVWRNILEMDAKDSTSVTEKHKDLLPVFTGIMRQIMGQRIHRSFRYHGVLAPWAQMACLQIFRVYLQHGLGSQKDMYLLVVECLMQMRKQVDAAYAIILECIKLLALMDSFFLDSMRETQDEDPFQILDQFLGSANLNLKYLGLLGVSTMQHDCWLTQWKDGVVFAEAMEAGYDDATIVHQTLELLKIVVQEESTIRPITNMVLAFLAKTCDVKENQISVATWFVDQLINTHCPIDVWFVETMIITLAATRKNLDRAQLESNCNLLKQALDNEVETSDMRERAVNTIFDIMKRNYADVLSAQWMILAFWVIGEYGYLSSHTEIDLMQQLLKWISLVSDNAIQIHGLQAMKRCMQRSKQWLSGLVPLLQEYKTSPIYEKQAISLELLDMVETAEFEQSIQAFDIVPLGNSYTLSSNPNRPQQVGPFQHESPGDPSPTKINVMDHSKRPIASSSSSTTRTFRAQSPPQTNRYIRSYTSEDVRHTRSTNLGSSRTQGYLAKHKMQPTMEESMLSSLIALDMGDETELVEDEPARMDTTTFGELWVKQPYEEKGVADWPLVRGRDFNQDAMALAQRWRLSIVQVIGQECIATAQRQQVLLHITTEPDSITLEWTARASSRTQLRRFLAVMH